MKRLRKVKKNGFKRAKNKIIFKYWAYTCFWSFSENIENRNRSLRNLRVVSRRKIFFKRRYLNQCKSFKLK